MKIYDAIDLAERIMKCYPADDGEETAETIAEDIDRDPLEVIDMLVRYIERNDKERASMDKNRAIKLLNRQIEINKKWLEGMKTAEDRKGFEDIIEALKMGVSALKEEGE